MIDRWQNLMVGGFLSLPKTARILEVKYADKFIRRLSDPSSQIVRFWREPLLEYLLRYPYYKMALALDYYRVGFFQLVTYKKGVPGKGFLAFSTQALYSSASCPFCVLTLLKGETCFECPLNQRGVFKSVKRWSGAYDRCAGSKPYLAIWDAINQVAEGKFRTCHIGNALREGGFLAELDKISRWEDLC